MDHRKELMEAAADAGKVFKIGMGKRYLKNRLSNGVKAEGIWTGD
jgi:hypothetical protein